jgi:hypothetical protein
MAMHTKRKKVQAGCDNFLFSCELFVVVTTKKIKKINVLRFLRKKMYNRKCLNISRLELEWI